MSDDSHPPEETPEQPRRGSRFRFGSGFPGGRISA
jgi:hypothetical protein